MNALQQLKNGGDKKDPKKTKSCSLHKEAISMKVYKSDNFCIHARCSEVALVA